MKPTNLRMAVERKIVLAAFDALVADGYEVAIDYERGFDTQTRTTSRDVFAAEIQECDEEWVMAWRPGETGKALGFVYFVYGNDDGTTVISDYSGRLEGAIKPALDLAEAMAAGGAL